MTFLKKHFYPLILFFIVLTLFVLNYQPGTHLTGWDNFNSELDPWLAVSQATTAAWSNFRSFGLPAGMGYATDLWRALLVWFMHFLLPINTIRYFVQFFFLLIGGLGAFSLFKRLQFSPILAFIGSTYYLLNFGTVQIFAFPYEPFSTFFALLPWTILSYLNLQDRFNRRHLLQFALANLFLSGAFWVQTMFIVYLLCLFCFSLPFLFTNFKSYFVNHTKIILIVLAINAYWLSSQVYFLTSTSVTNLQNAKQTLLGWDIPFYQNASHSNFSDFFLQKGFYLDYNSDSSSYFSPWITFFQQPFIRLLQLSLIFILLIGILDGHHHLKINFSLLLLLHAIVLLMTIPPFREINNLTRLLPVVDQIFRAPFSKFTMSLSLVFAYFFILGLNSVASKIKLPQIAFFLALVLITILNLPSFNKHFFVSQMKANLPADYLQLFDFFRSRPSSQKIALFPETDIWGWYAYSWGYVGSGFIWHGIHQPIISRSYDVWSRNSENYYWEITHALDQNDSKLINEVFRKYHISYILIDNSLTNGSATNRYHQLDRLNSLIRSSSEFTPVFNTSTLSVYQLNFTPPSEFVTTDHLSNIGPASASQYLDSAFLNHSHYQTDPTSPYDYYYPFLDLQTNSYNPNQRWQIKETNDSLTITSLLPTSIDKNYQLYLPEYPGLSSEIDNHQLMVTIPKLQVNYQNYNGIQPCDDSSSMANIQITTSSINSQLTVKKGSKACWYYHFDDAILDTGYLLKTPTTNISGPPLTVSVTDHTTQNTLLSSQLNSKLGQLYILPAISSPHFGFSVSYQSQSFSNINAVNQFQPPTAYIFPDRLLHQIFFSSAKPSQSPSLSPATPLISTPWLHILPPIKSRHLIFNQSFDHGWLAFGLENHQLANNWANSWSTPTPSNKTIYLIFWPQLLQFLGFALIPIVFLLAFRHQH